MSLLHKPDMTVCMMQDKYVRIQDGSNNAQSTHAQSLDSLLEHLQLASMPVEPILQQPPPFGLSSSVSKISTLSFGPQLDGEVASRR